VLRSERIGDNPRVVRRSRRADQAIRRLDLTVGYPTDWPHDDPEFPGVKILVDGHDLLTWAGSHGPYRGPWPPALLEDESPLLPVGRPRRVSLYSEGTMEPDEGNITAVVAAAKQHVIWSDFRECPADTAVDASGMEFGLLPPGCSPVSVPDLVFDRDQYLAEVLRVIAERDWESDRWRTARLLDEYLGQAIRDRGGLADETLYPYRAEPADTDGTGFLVTLWDQLIPRHGAVLALSTGPGTPEQRAQSMTAELMALAPDEWPVVRRMDRA